VLEHIDAPVSQALLVAGYSTQPNTNDEPVLQKDYDWPAIKAHVADLYFINSRDDPYGCDDTQGRSMFEQLGGTRIVRDDGHFGDAGQPYETFELLDRLIAWGCSSIRSRSGRDRDDQIGAGRRGATPRSASGVLSGVVSGHG
jgi:predicted alpha/beta hydrolase family esterase